MKTAAAGPAIDGSDDAAAAEALAAGAAVGTSTASSVRVVLGVEGRDGAANDSSGSSRLVVPAGGGDTAPDDDSVGRGVPAGGVSSMEVAAPASRWSTGADSPSRVVSTSNSSAATSSSTSTAGGGAVGGA